MKSRFLVALALCAAIVLADTGARAAKPGTATVQAAVARFYAALNTLFTGQLEPMIKLWSHRPDVTYMGPGGGFRHGWPEVLADWEGQAKMKLGGSVEPKDITITVGHDLAIVSDLEVGHNVVDGKRQDLTLRATNLFRREHGTWKMIGHHTDTLPYLQK